MMKLKSFFLFLLFSVILAYYFIDPKVSSWTLMCPFKSVTSYDCPGCGSQRAFHEVLHGNLDKAFILNPLFVIAIPFFVQFLVFQIGDLKMKYLKCYQIIFGFKSILVYLVILILFFIVRNTSFYHEAFSRL
ncbi:DUF2752 domain-containing protein [Chryseobacterium sp. POL2]|nr:DUF2752 domain-containing protein [Chryseobacterium sp. POL2]